MRRSLAVALVTVSLGCTSRDPPSSQAADEATKVAPSILPDKPAPGPTDGVPLAQSAPAPPSAAQPAAELPPIPRPLSPDLGGKGSSTIPLPLSPEIGGKGAGGIGGPSATPSVPSAPPPASAAAEVKSVMSPKTIEPSFNVWMQSAGKYKAGQQGAVQVVLVAKGDFHCNDKYPYKFKLGAAPAAVSYPQPVVRTDAISITPDRSVMSIPILPSAPGDARVGGTFSFSVCNATSCQIESRELSLNIKID